MTDQNSDTEPKRPEATKRHGSAKAAIWRNEGENGAFRSTTITRTFEDKDGNVRDTHSFRKNDLLEVSELARWAFHTSDKLEREERRAAFKEERQEQGSEKQKGRER